MAINKNYIDNESRNKGGFIMKKKSRYDAINQTQELRQAYGKYQQAKSDFEMGQKLPGLKNVTRGKVKPGYLSGAENKYKKLRKRYVGKDSLN